MYNNFKVDAIVQARMGSARLPGKTLLPLIGKPVLQHIIERLRRSQYIDDVIVATTTNETDQPIVDLCEKLDCKYFRGSEDDVLTRVLDTARYFKTDIIVEITADCPCIDPYVVDSCIKCLEGFDYASNVIKRTYPRGYDTQVFWTKTLKRVNKEVDNDVDRQHVSSWIYKNPKGHMKYHRWNDTHSGNFSNIRLTLDNELDYQLIKFVFEAFGNNEFSYTQLSLLYHAMPEMFEINQQVEQKSYYKELAEAYGKLV